MNKLRGQKPISYCPFCKRYRYAESDAKCGCAPALDKDKVPRLVGLTNRHIQRAQNAQIQKILRDYKLLSKLRARPIKSIKYSEELRNAQQSQTQPSPDQGQVTTNEVSEPVKVVSDQEVPCL